MRIGYLIGALGVGGSERQLSLLAASMARRGHAVEVFAYDGTGPFDEAVVAGGAVVRHGSGGGKVAKLRHVRAWLRTTHPDVLHCFMKRASSLAVLANGRERVCPVVASDLSTATYSRHKPSLWASLFLFHWADAVATQTETNRRSLELLAPWLRGKTRVIRNGLDLSRFGEATREASSRLRFLAVGTVYGLKNPVRLVEAAARLAQEGADFELDWVGPYGQTPEGSEAYREAQAGVVRHGLTGKVRFLGPRSDMPAVYPLYDALVHVSVQEGMPNAVIEAMACGLPVVVSRVSDLPLIVENARNGVVCDPRSVASIAEALKSMLSTSPCEREAMGRRGRELAGRWFGLDRFAVEYEALYSELCAGMRAPTHRED